MKKRLRDLDLNEAFMALEDYKEDIVDNKIKFDLHDANDISELKSYMDEPEKEEVEMVVDLDAEDEDSLQDSYIGDILLQCNVCKKLIYRKDTDIIPTEDEEGNTVYNVDMECPECGCVGEGFTLIGKVDAYDPEKSQELQDEEDEVEEAPEDFEEGDSIEDGEHTEEEDLEESKEEKEPEDKEDREEVKESLDESKLAEAPEGSDYSKIRSLTDKNDEEVIKTIDKIKENLSVHTERIAKADKAWHDLLDNEKFYTIADNFISDLELHTADIPNTYIIESNGIFNLLFNKTEETPEEDWISLELLDNKDEGSGVFYVDSTGANDDQMYNGLDGEDLANEYGIEALFRLLRASNVTNVDKLFNTFYSKLDKALESVGLTAESLNESNDVSLEDLDESLDEGKKNYSMKEIKADKDFWNDFDKPVLMGLVNSEESKKNERKMFGNPDVVLKPFEKYDEDKLINILIPRLVEEGHDYVGDGWHENSISILNKLNYCIGDIINYGGTRGNIRYVDQLDNINIKIYYNNYKEKSHKNESLENDIVLEDLDESLFDNLANDYLNEIYENVESYKTTDGSVDNTNNKLIIEGTIKFKSGREQSTKFIFEADSMTKRGRVKFKGLNETFTKKNKAFTLQGRITEGKLLPETLQYNYLAKSLNESKRIYGRSANKLTEGMVNITDAQEKSLEAIKDYVASEDFSGIPVEERAVKPEDIKNIKKVIKASRKEDDEIDESLKEAKEELTGEEYFDEDVVGPHGKFFVEYFEKLYPEDSGIIHFDNDECVVFVKPQDCGVEADEDDFDDFFEDHYNEDNDVFFYNTTDDHIKVNKVAKDIHNSISKFKKLAKDNFSDEVDESLKEEKSLEEANWKKHIDAGKELRQAINAEDYQAIVDALVKCYNEAILKADEDQKEDLENALEDLKFSLYSNGESGELDSENIEDMEDTIDYYLDEFYDYCDAFRFWVALEEGCEKEECDRKHCKDCEEEKEDSELTEDMDDDEFIPKDPITIDDVENGVCPKCGKKPCECKDESLDESSRYKVKYEMLTDISSDESSNIIKVLSNSGLKDDLEYFKEDGYNSIGQIDIYDDHLILWFEDEYGIDEDPGEDGHWLEIGTKYDKNEYDKIIDIINSKLESLDESIQQINITSDEGVADILTDTDNVEIKAEDNKLTIEIENKEEAPLLDDQSIDDEINSEFGNAEAPAPVEEPEQPTEMIAPLEGDEIVSDSEAEDEIGAEFGRAEDEENK